MRTKSAVFVALVLFLYIAPIISSSNDIFTTRGNSSDYVLANGENWLDGWTYRREIHIVGSAGAGTAYQIPITVLYSTHMQTDFDDIRFTDNDGDTLLYHWRESYTASTTSLFWVKVADNLNSDVVIYMYYGNSTVSDASEGTGTFPWFYEDWEGQTESVAVWSWLSSAGVVSYSTVGATHGSIAHWDANNGGTMQIVTLVQSSAPCALRFRSNIEEATTGNTARQGSGYDGAFGFSLIQTVATGESFYVYDDLGNPDTQAMTTAYFDAWITFEITRDGTNAKLYADNVLIETASFDPDAVSSNPICSIRLTDTEDDFYSDWMFQRKFIASEPYLDPSWHMVEEIELDFFVEIDTWPIHMIIFICGLALIPASTLFLAYSSKHKPTPDKFLIGVFAFLMGFALIFGGIAG